MPISTRAQDWTMTAGIVVCAILVWFAGSSIGLWSPAVIPSPQEVAEAFGAVVQTSEYWESIVVTLKEIVLSFVCAVAIGVTIGVLFWRVPYLGRISEPYLVSLYAVPFIVFYPIMVVLIGLNMWPTIVIAVVMGTIPVILNTWIALSSVAEVYWKLAASLECSRRQTMLRVAVPAAAPIAMAGIRLAAFYALIGCISMEFLLAPSGLGSGVRDQYELFDQPAMIVYVLTIFVIGAIIALLITSLEWRVTGRRSGR